MGPVIDAAARERIHHTIERGGQDGARLVRGGQPSRHERGFFVTPTLFEQARPEMAIAREETFGPVLSMLHPRDLDEAIAWANGSPYGNGAVIFTTSGGAAGQFTRDIGRRQRRRAGTEGSVRVLWLEGFVLRRPARSGAGGNPVLHPPEDRPVSVGQHVPTHSRLVNHDDRAIALFNFNLGATVTRFS